MDYNQILDKAQLTEDQKKLMLQLLSSVTSSKNELDSSAPDAENVAGQSTSSEASTSEKKKTMKKCRKIPKSKGNVNSSKDNLKSPQSVNELNRPELIKELKIPKVEAKSSTPTKSTNKKNLNTSNKKKLNAPQPINNLKSPTAKGKLNSLISFNELKTSEVEAKSSVPTKRTNKKKLTSPKVIELTCPANKVNCSEVIDAFKSLKPEDKQNHPKIIGELKSPTAKGKLNALISVDELKIAEVEAKSNSPSKSTIEKKLNTPNKKSPTAKGKLSMIISVDELKNSEVEAKSKSPTKNRTKKQLNSPNESKLTIPKAIDDLKSPLAESKPSNSPKAMNMLKTKAVKSKSCTIKKNVIISEEDKFSFPKNIDELKSQDGSSSLTAPTTKDDLNISDEDKFSFPIAINKLVSSKIKGRKIRVKAVNKVNAKGKSKSPKVKLSSPQLQIPEVTGTSMGEDLLTNESPNANSTSGKDQCLTVSSNEKDPVKSTVRERTLSDAEILEKMFRDSPVVVLERVDEESLDSKFAWDMLTKIKVEITSPSKSDDYSSQDKQSTSESTGNEHVLEIGEKSNESEESMPVIKRKPVKRTLKKDLAVQNMLSHFNESSTVDKISKDSELSDLDASTASKDKQLVSGNNGMMPPPRKRLKKQAAKKAAVCTAKTPESDMDVVSGEEVVNTKRVTANKRKRLSEDNKVEDTGRKQVVLDQSECIKPPKKLTKKASIEVDPQTNEIEMSIDCNENLEIGHENNLGAVEDGERPNQELQFGSTELKSPLKRKRQSPRTQSVELKNDSGKAIVVHEKDCAMEESNLEDNESSQVEQLESFSITFLSKAPNKRNVTKKKPCIKSTPELNNEISVHNLIGLNEIKQEGQMSSRNETIELNPPILAKKSSKKIINNKFVVEAVIEDNRPNQEQQFGSTKLKSPLRRKQQSPRIQSVELKKDNEKSIVLDEKEKNCAMEESKLDDNESSQIEQLEPLSITFLRKTPNKRNVTKKKASIQNTPELNNEIPVSNVDGVDETKTQGKMSSQDEKIESNPTILAKKSSKQTVKEKSPAVKSTLDSTETKDSESHNESNECDEATICNANKKDKVKPNKDNEKDKVSPLDDSLDISLTNSTSTIGKKTKKQIVKNDLTSITRTVNIKSIQNKNLETNLNDGHSACNDTERQILANENTLNEGESSESGMLSDLNNFYSGPKTRQRQQHTQKANAEIDKSDVDKTPNKNLNSEELLIVNEIETNSNPEESLSTEQSTSTEVAENTKSLARRQSKRNLKRKADTHSIDEVTESAERCDLIIKQESGIIEEVVTDESHLMVNEMSNPDVLVVPINPSQPKTRKNSHVETKVSTLSNNGLPQQPDNVNGIGTDVSQDNVNPPMWSSCIIEEEASESPSSGRKTSRSKSHVRMKLVQMPQIRKPDVNLWNPPAELTLNQIESNQIQTAPSEVTLNKIESTELTQSQTVPSELIQDKTAPAKENLNQTTPVEETLNQIESAEVTPNQTVPDEMTQNNIPPSDAVSDSTPTNESEEADTLTFEEASASLEVVSAEEKKEYDASSVMQDVCRSLNINIRTLFRNQKLVKKLNSKPKKVLDPYAFLQPHRLVNKNTVASLNICDSLRQLDETIKLAKKR